MPDFPGGLVRQNNYFAGEQGDCYSACVSMLTGIDLDILPVHPPRLRTSGDPSIGVHIERTTRWDSWEALMADNGYSMETTDDIPADKMGIVTMYHMFQNIGHAFAQDLNGSLYNPFDLSPAGMSSLMRDGWVPVAFTTIISE